MPGAVAPGYQVEIRTSGDAHRILVGVPASTGDVVVLTVHVPVADWDVAAPVALDRLRGLTAG